MWNLSEKDRWRLYRRWVSDARQNCFEAISDFQEMFDEKVDELKEVRKQQDYEILKNADVIGMTTTGNIHFSFYSSPRSICFIVKGHILLASSLFQFQVRSRGKKQYDARARVNGSKRERRGLGRAAEILPFFNFAYFSHSLVCLILPGSHHLKSWNRLVSTSGKCSFE